ncbi:hypothetical protein [Georgenia yuyongxinii]|uniref:Uncharacterized protein n=1 Tax=Georgenia yuyongxinii TaxID=2589797 RepID=A0A552WW86_9MICO|nr:hypothetical protein [Georgenia yuyongxinii]TRW46849.1 hypothetical protein FJ693_03825 [Georgenia yuyongxinii]
MKTPTGAEQSIPASVRTIRRDLLDNVLIRAAGEEGCAAGALCAVVGSAGEACPDRSAHAGGVIERQFEAKFVGQLAATRAETTTPASAGMPAGSPVGNGRRHGMPRTVHHRSARCKGDHDRGDGPRARRRAHRPSETARSRVGTVPLLPYRIIVARRWTSAPSV